MQNVASIYKTQQAKTSWTRIEMLLELYDFAIASLEALRDKKEDSGYPEQDRARDLLRAQKAIWGIYSGLDEESEISQNVMRLLLFVSMSVEKADYEPALNVVNNLRQAFASIKEEANRLEHSGDIPPLKHQSEIEVTL